MADTFKNEVAMGIAAKIGALLEKRKGELEARITHCQGAQEASRHLAKKMNDYQSLVKKECEEDDVDIEVLRRISRHVTNCALMAEKFGHDQNKLISHILGKMDGLTEAINLVHVVHNQEKGQMERLVEAETQLEAPPPPAPEKKNGSGPKEATPEEIRALMNEHDKASLILLAGKAGVSSQGSKAAIAKRILER